MLSGFELEPPVRYLNVSVRNLDKEVKALPATNLRVALKGAKVRIYPPVLGSSLLGQLANCGGKGLCGKCVIRVVDNPAGLTDRTPSETKLLGPTSPQARLACQAQICDDVTIDVRKTQLNSVKGILEEAEAARANHDKIIGAA